jgi:hypothetical protein
MTAEQFNKKYEKWLESGHYGLDIYDEAVVNYLDEKFQELTKNPHFSFSQIKTKFNWACFYADGVTGEQRSEIEHKIEELLNLKNEKISKHTEN